MASKKQRLAKLERGLQQMHDAAKGVFTINCVYRGSMPEVLLAAIGGDLEAQDRVMIVAPVERMITASPRNSLCLLCEATPLSDASNVAAILWVAAFRPAGDAARNTHIANWVCDDCAERLGTPDALRDAALDMWREMMPDLRHLGPIREAGHA
jgi:hypothetical protein